MNKKILFVAIVSVLIVFSLYFILFNKKSSEIEISDVEMNEAQIALKKKLQENNQQKEKTLQNLSEIRKDPQYIAPKIEEITTVRKGLDAVKKILDCYEKEKCGPKIERDPKHRNFALSYELQDTLKKITPLIQTGNEGDVLEVMKFLKDHDDDWVKEQLVEFSSKIKPTKNNFSLLNEVLISSDDPSIFEKAMNNNFKQFNFSDMKDSFLNFFEKNLTSSKYYTPLYLAEKLPQYLNSDNISDFKKILTKMQKSSGRYQLVHKAISNFK